LDEPARTFCAGSTEREELAEGPEVKCVTQQLNKIWTNCTGNLLA
jgi:hypothetical protein